MPKKKGTNGGKGKVGGEKKIIVMPWHVQKPAWYDRSMNAADALMSVEAWKEKMWEEVQALPPVSSSEKGGKKGRDAPDASDDLMRLMLLVHLMHLLQRQDKTR
jgi:hypothetical protein